MTLLLRILSCVLALGMTVSLSSAQSLRALPVKSSLQVIIPTEEGYLVDFSHIKPVLPHIFISVETVTNYIPTDLEDGASGNTVFRKILDRSLRTVLKNPQLQKTGLAKTANVISEQVSTDFDFSTGNDDVVRHKVKLQMKAFESKAVFKYSGFFDANLSYRMADQVAELELNQTLGRSSTLSLNLIQSRLESLSMVKFQLNF